MLRHPTPRRPLARPRLQRLEDRTAPVVGAFEVPALVSSTNTSYQGVVAYGDTAQSWFCTGTLVENGRYILTAAHCVDGDGDGVPNNSEYVVRFDLPSGPTFITVPAANVTIHPGWAGNANIADGSDAAVIKLPVLAPFGNGSARVGYPLATQQDEVGLRGTLVGYGYTGTGTTDEAVNVLNGDTAEVQRLTINGTGPVVLSLLGRSRTLSSNPTAIGVQAAINDIAVEFPGQFLVRVSEVDTPGNPNNGSFEVVFFAVFPGATGFNGSNAPPITLTPGPGFSGTASAVTLLDGGTEGKRLATNVSVGTLPGGVLDAIFVGAQGFGALGRGDSGGPLFINGHIAGIASFGEITTRIGDQTAWGRVSSFRGFLDPIIDAGPYALTIDLSVQPGAADGAADAVRVSRSGGMLQVTLNGLLIFSAPAGEVTGLTLVSSGDGLTVTQVGAVGVPITAPVPVTKILADLRAFGAGPGAGPHVRVVDPATGQERFSFFAYPELVTSGVVVATGDVNGDGTPDIITAPGVGFSPHVKVFDGVTGQLIRSFFAFAEGVTTGLSVASGDLDGDGFDDIVVGAGTGAGPAVTVFSGRDGSVLRSFYAFDPAFLGGVRVAAGDVDGDGKADIIAGAGPGGGSLVNVFRGTDLALLQSFMALGAVPGGVTVAAIDVDGDGLDDVVVGSGPGAPPRVVARRGTDQSVLFDLMAFAPGFLGGVTLAGFDDPATGTRTLSVGSGAGVSAVVATFDLTTMTEVARSIVYVPQFLGGVYVG